MTQREEFNNWFDANDDLTLRAAFSAGWQVAQAAQPVQTGWQDISTAPKDGTEVLLYGQWGGEINGVNTHASIDLGRWIDGTSDFPGTDWWQLITGDAYACWMKATHWMPLPESPEVK